MHKPITILLLAICTAAFGGSDDVFLTENKGQWHPAVHFKAGIPAGALYLDDGGFTVQLFDPEALSSMHTGHKNTLFSDIRQHVVKTRFLQANPNGGYQLPEPTEYYSNYYIGNDPSRWASGVKSYPSARRKNLYDGVDLRVYRQRGVVKYDLHVLPGADPEVLKVQYDGPDSLRLIDGQLHVFTSVQDYIEQPPFAYQMDGGRLTRVPCHYQLDGAVISYVFPEGYDPSRELIIDPEISFSSYVGSGQSSFGYTATYDEDGNLYAGAISFGQGYPTSAGAIDPTHNGGAIDIGISKFSADGTQLLYSTFLGGAGNESPHSLVVNEDNELYLLGSTGSPDFPTTPGSHDPTFNGGPLLNFNIGYGFSHPDGTDIVVAKFNADGTNLLASTFMGGSGNDGLNIDPLMEYNYGDAFRGEIIVDDNSAVYVASVTTSSDFPVTAGALQTTYDGGDTDGCLFKLNADLSVLEWSTYYGGNTEDACYSVQIADDGSVYVAGGTTSPDLPMTAQSLVDTESGSVDGFVARLTADGSTLLGATYLGTSAYDQCFFVQLDTEGNVFVVGQTEGPYPVSGDVYTNPNSGHFVHKFDENLQNSLLSTVVGNGNGGPNISISAFLVSNCDQIYISGWGGDTNSGSANILTSTTDGLPVTADAFQPVTDGDDFYLMVLSADAEELVYATFFGGGSSNEHVDGGTSRFDKRGTVYQAVCAGCGGNDDFPTQSGVWSETNTSSLANGQCNLGVFKFDLTTIVADIAIDGPDEVCAGQLVSFINNTSVADQFDWDFGGQGSANSENPSFTFDEPGTYTVSMVATHSDECIQPDSTEIEITILPPPEIEVSTSTTICPGDSTELFVSGGDNYLWSPAGQVDDPTSENPTVWADETTTFFVNLEAQCGNLTDTVTVNVWEEDYGAGEDQIVCLGESVGISAFGGGTYSWTPAASLNNASIANPAASPEEATTYTCEITSPNGCVYTASVNVSVLPGLPEVETSPPASICDGGSVGIWASGGDSYLWAPTPGLNAYDVPNPLASPSTNTWYVVNVSNACGTVQDSALVNIGVVTANVEPTDTVCPGGTIQLNASGGVTYAWYPAETLDDPISQTPVASPFSTTTYTVVVTDQYGCAEVTNITVPVYQPPYVFAGMDVVADFMTWESVDAQSNGTLTWESDLPLTCTECPSPSVQATESGAVYVTAVDSNGCAATDSLLVQVIGSLFVPNAITPNGDGINDFFRAVGSEIEEFHLQIFNRWGELIFETRDIDEGWNGGVDQHYVESEVYIWDIRAKEQTGVTFERRGHVTVIR